MVAVCEAVAPRYTIKYYNEHLYRVVKRLCDAHRPITVSDRSRKEHSVKKFSSALSRAKTAVRDIALCNEWEYFVTLTFDKEKCDRYDLQGLTKDLMQWLQNLNKENKRIRYLLVPEFHEDGAVHFHGLMSGIEATTRPEWWPKDVNLKKKLYKQTGRREYYDHWKACSDKFGYSSVDPVKDMVAVGFYVSKYITKSLAEKAEYKGVHTYYRSHGLKRCVDVGYAWGASFRADVLDRILEKEHKRRKDAAKEQNREYFEPKYYDTAFFKRNEFVDALCLCDEVENMFSSYIISDPVSGEIVAITGGDDEDKEVQLMLAAFEVDGFTVEQIPIEGERT